MTAHLRLALRPLAIALALSFFCWLCASATAAFPGRDGELAVQPLSGGGIVLVHPDGSGASQICTDRLLCGRPVTPRFSPDGRAIVFEDAQSSRIAIVGADGSCLWCLLGSALTGDLGSQPSFSTDGAVTFVGHGGAALDRIQLTGGRAHRAAPGPVSDGLVSGRGGLAVVRIGWIYVRGASGKLRRLTRGRSPSWSPSGSYLAFSRGGWVWKIAADGGRAVRLTRGSAPAWSPDRRRIAYIGSAGRVYTITAGGRQRRSVGTVRGREVDWQPLPRQAVPCASGNGAIVAQSRGSVVRQAVSGGEGSSGSIGWNGCLRLLGVHHHLNGGPHFGGCYDFLGLSGIALAGRYSAMGFAACDHEGPECQNIVAVYDLSRGSAASSFEPQDDSCLSMIDSLRVDSSGFSAWRVRTALGQTSTSLSSISCPSAALCVAGDAAGNILTSTNPGGGAGAWTVTGLGRGAIGVSCPTISFCLGVVSGGVVTTTDPLGGRGAWTFTPVNGEHHLGAVSCASASLCAILDDDGDVAASNDPTGGAAAWTVTRIDTFAPTPFDQEDGISCPSASLCVVTDRTGHVITSTDPTGGASAWTTGELDSAGLTDVSCASTSLCAATGLDGNVWITTDPAGGASAWIAAKVEPYRLQGISCPSMKLCVATDGENAVTSTDPTGGPAAWRTAPVGSSFSADTASCASDSFCALVDGGGHILHSNDPAAGGSSYTSTLVDAPPCARAGTPCLSERLYVHDDQGTHMVDSAPAGMGTVIGNLELTGNSLTLTWRHGGQARSLDLR